MTNSLLLVPIHLDALHLKNGTSVIEAMVEFNRLPYFRGDRDVNPDIVNLSESIVSKAFQNRNLYLKPGIHLHWALPDALTKAGADGEFPIVPNRWLITRKSKEGELKRWVVESDYLYPATDKFQEDSITYPYRDTPNLPPFRYLGRKLIFEDWINIQSGKESDQYLERLTAVGYGEPTFAAFYPNCRSVFGFHDPELFDPTTLSDLTYDVIGWCNHEKDYLSNFFGSFRDSFKKDNSKEDSQEASKGPTPEDWIDTIERDLNWKIVTRPPSLNNILKERPEQRKERINLLKQTFDWQETLNEDSLIPQTVCFSHLTFNSKEYTGQSLLETANVKLAVANTGTEALSAYLAETINPSCKAIVEEQLEALQLTETLEQQQLDTGFKFEELRHEAGFNAVPGGSLWRIQLDTANNQSNSETTSAQTTLNLPDELSTLLNDLNQAQQTYDSVWAEIISRRRQLFCDWYKYMVSTYPPENSWDIYPNIDEVKAYIQEQGITPLMSQLAQVGTLNLIQDDSGKLSSASGSVQSQAAAIAVQINNLIKEINTHNEAVRQEYSRRQEEGESLPPPPVYSLERTSSARYWEPKEPVVLIVGDDAISSTQRHGEDGRLDPDGLLNCHLLTLPEQIGKISEKQSFQEIYGQILAKLDELQQADPKQIGFATWEKQPWNPILLEWLVELFPVAEGSNKTNETDYNYRHDFITKNYSLETNAVDLSPSSPLSLKPDIPNPIKIDTEPNIYSGSSILTPYANLLLQKRIEEYLSKHKNDGEDSLENPIYRKLSDYETLLAENKLDKEIENYLRQNLSKRYPEYDRIIRIDANRSLRNLAEIRAIKQWYENNELDNIPHPVAIAKQAESVLQNLHCLSQALGGFNQALLMHKQTLQLIIEDPIGFEDYQAFTERVQDAVGDEIRSAPQPLDDFNPIRSGEMRIIDLQLIDTFGQFRNLEWKDSSGNESVIKPESMKASVLNRIALSPRFVQPCRINFRWLSAFDQDNREVSDHPSTNPICGWILPNNLNDSLMIYGSDGQALGSININAEWDYAPGETQVATNQIENPHLKKVVQTIINLGDSFVKHFNECLNNALNNIDPENFAQHQSLALLMGRPIAVVRASINFELQGLPAISQDWNVFRQEMARNAPLKERDRDNFVGVEIPIRIGEYRQFNDGVIGYWKEKKSASEKIEYENKIFYAQQSDVNESQYIETQFWDESNNPGGAEESPINIIQSIDSNPQTLTMLVDPRGLFHATSGVLPSKVISIPPEHYAKALANIKATFLTTPILTEQTQQGNLKLPLPTAPDYDWAWLEKQARKENLGTDIERWIELLTVPVLEKSVFTQTYSEHPDFQNQASGETAWTALVNQQWLIELSDSKAKIVPKDKRPKLQTPLENLDEAIEKLFDLKAVSIQPVTSKAIFTGSQEIREGWLVLSEPQKPIELPDPTPANATP